MKEMLSLCLHCKYYLWITIVQMGRLHSQKSENVNDRDMELEKTLLPWDATTAAWLKPLQALSFKNDCSAINSTLQGI